MKSYTPNQIRNVALIGHGGSGKTTLSEAFLFVSGAINRLGRVDDGNTASDFDAEEIKRHMSINLSMVPAEWRDTKLNVIDTPGYADFIGEVRAALHVADGALMVLCAASGVEVGSEITWGMAAERSLPRLILVNRMDRENADFARTLEQARQLLGGGCVPLQLPIGSASAFRGIVDLVGQRAYLGPQAEEGPIPAELESDVAIQRERLVEAAAETDDDLLAKYLEGEGLSDEEVIQGLRRGIRAGKVFPVLVGSGAHCRGVDRLLDAIVDYIPAPTETPACAAREIPSNRETALTSDPKGPLAALVFKSTADPYIGKLTYLRVYSGTLNSDSHVWNAGRGREERLGTLYVMRGKNQEPVGSVGAGDIGAVAKLAETTTGDTLCQRERPVAVPAPQFPVPNFSVALYPRTKADLDKMGSALARLVEEDPTLRVSREHDTSETILAGVGESHLDIAVEKMKRKFGVELTVSAPKVPYKETITAGTKAEYKHKKQTGGHGQYGHVFLALEPLPRGSTFHFEEKVVGGVVPRNYIPAVEKGVHEALQEGVIAHYPVVDVRVVLYDGSYHPVDSSDLSFKLAGLMAFKKGMSQAQPALLEPIVKVSLEVPSNFQGDVMSDLNGRRARLLGASSQGGTAYIEALAPLAEIQRYATVLRSITQGRGSFSLEFDHYDEVPAHLAQAIVAANKQQGES
ncbi:MAG: elongation factor G [Chloroflexi bacterium]|nr:elongation factor G [Chloroflexota bacterium]